MAETAVVNLLKELSTFLLNQSYNLGEELQRDFHFISQEFRSMTAFLRDAESKEHNALELQEWIRQVRQVAYDTEDVIDEYVLHLSRHRPHGFLGHAGKIYRSIKSLRARHWISSELKNLKSRVTDISERHKRFQALYGDQGTVSGSSLVANSDNEIRACSILVEEAELVGIDTPKRVLISEILDNDPRRKVISVVGMGGLGKTTLVKKVYNDTAVRKEFKIRAWLTISGTFQIMAVIKNLIQDIFHQLDETVPPQLVESTDLVRLGELVKDSLHNRRYIIVLDDVWNGDLWEALQNVLPDRNRYGRVILTTRIDDVASAASLGDRNHIYKMKPLSGKDSWTLFCNKTFESNRCPPNLKEVSAHILKKCEGLPLAITAIGGVLALKKGKISDWNMILRSLGGEPEGSGKIDRLKRILLLSYNDLPHYLRNCFLYLSIYKEDYQINVKILLEKWIAEGFVQEKEGMSSFDIANGYAHELVNRSLLQVASTRADGTVLHCRVHDVWRNIIVTHSGEQNFVRVARGNYNGQMSNKVRRLAIQDFIDNKRPDDLNHCLQSLRSLQFLGNNKQVSGQVVSKFLRGSSKLLNVLDLDGASLEDIPKEIFKLFHLRYLRLSKTQIRTIPKSVGMLQNLEILYLFGTNVTELPVEVSQLRKLRSLRVVEYDDYPKTVTCRGVKCPDGIGKLVALEHLDAIEADNTKIVREIGKLTKLRSLSITKLRKEDGKELACSLEKLINLRDLWVDSIKEEEPLDLQYSMSPTHRFLRALGLSGRIESIPEWVISLPNLTSLILEDSGLRESDATGEIGCLKDLPNLMGLDLIGAYEGETLLFRGGGFQKLKRLCLWRLERLKWVREEDESLPSLQELVMRDCKRVEELPLGTKMLRKLDTLYLRDMGDELVGKVQNLSKESEEYQALSSIPEFLID